MSQETCFKRAMMMIGPSKCLKGATPGSNLDQPRQHNNKMNPSVLIMLFLYEKRLDIALLFQINHLLRSKGMYAQHRLRFSSIRLKLASF